MTLYLKLSGSNNKITTPSVAFNKIVMEFNMVTAQTSSSYFYYFDLRPTSQAWMYGHKTRADESYIGVSNIKVDGTTTTSMSSIPRDVKTTVEVNFSSVITSPIIFFQKNDGTYSATGNVYRLKAYNGTTLVFDYDMSKGNVNDQSGNGRNGTLTGGSWLDDGVSTGVDGSTVFDLQQSIYAEGLLALDTKQSLYTDSTLTMDVEQVIYRNSSSLFNTMQSFYTELTFQSDTLQEFFNEVNLTFDTTQQIYDISGNVTIPFDVLVQLYNESAVPNDMEQILYNSSTSTFDTKQTIYFEDENIVGDIIFLDGEYFLYVYLVGEQELNVHLQGEQTLNVNLKGVIS